MAQDKKRKRKSDLFEYTLFVLLKEGPLTLGELQEHIALQRTMVHTHRERQRLRPEEELGIASTCEKLESRKLIRLTNEAKYELTEEGKVQAENFERLMEKGAAILENQFLSPTATARNTTAGYVVLSILKLLAGLFSGSVGLIADGSDTAVDTIAAALVWLGIKLKKEVVGTITIIVLMFVTAILLFFDSVNSGIENIRGVFTPMSMPYVVIFIELLAGVSMFAVSMYQRYVGKRSQSLALISQSVDSKNSVYSSIAVIIGATLSIVGIHWVDAVVGGFIAARISLDGLDLSHEVVKSMRGQKPEFSKYKLPFQKQIEQARMENFQNWVMYTIHEDKLGSQEQIVASLEKAFRPSYMPALFSEFTVGREFDFQNSFTRIVKPLIDKQYLREESGTYSITDKGKTHVKDTVSFIKYKQTEL